MSIEEFPEIEAFHKLPRRVIVKGGMSRINDKGNAELSGIVINNLRQPVKQVKVNLIIFNQSEIPIYNTTTFSDPERLSNGAIASFKFELEGIKDRLTNFYLYPSWNYDDSEWA